LAGTPFSAAWAEQHRVKSEDDAAIENGAAIDAEPIAPEYAPWFGSSVKPVASVVDTPEPDDAGSFHAPTESILAGVGRGWSALGAMARAARQSAESAMGAPARLYDRVLPDNPEQARENVSAIKHRIDRAVRDAEEAREREEKAANDRALSKDIDKRMRRGGGSIFPHDDDLF
jgi:hypothetical protein